mmetsp:Transcript_86760/g.173171  ORF Transcript_86760/g.173171 Transcript_86760/m.173171 type:complete len:344 (-) Transcript_86760:398-1429(-)
MNIAAAWSTTGGREGLGAGRRVSAERFGGWGLGAPDAAAAPDAAWQLGAAACFTAPWGVAAALSAHLPSPRLRRYRCLSARARRLRREFTLAAFLASQDTLEARVERPNFEGRRRRRKPPQLIWSEKRRADSSLLEVGPAATRLRIVNNRPAQPVLAHAGDLGDAAVEVGHVVGDDDPLLGVGLEQQLDDRDTFGRISAREIGDRDCSWLPAQQLSARLGEVGGALGFVVAQPRDRAGVEKHLDDARIAVERRMSQCCLAAAATEQLGSAGARDVLRHAAQVEVRVDVRPAQALLDHFECALIARIEEDLVRAPLGGLAIRGTGLARAVRSRQRSCHRALARR